MAPKVKRIGPTVVYQPSSHEEHTIDIVLVHGLFGNPEKSWSRNVPVEGSPRLSANEDSMSGSSEGDEPETPSRKKTRFWNNDLFQNVFWPRDLLPKEFPQARIIVWGYDVDVGKVTTASSQLFLMHHAQDLLLDIAMLKSSEAEKQKPVLFIAHSLGGIVVKDALSLPGSEATFADTMGVIFLGTPHRGSEVASLGKIAFEASRFLWKKPNIGILQSLERNSEVLKRISRSFGQLLTAGRIRVHSFREELPSKGVMIVDLGSSTIGYLRETQGSLHANHRDIAKFSSLQDPNFRRLVSVMRGWIEARSKERRALGPVDQIGNNSPLPDGAIFDKELQLCLRSLYSAEAKRRYKDVEAAFQRTYKWLFEHKVGFENWLEGKNSNNVYWIQGKPGSGKSTIMKYALEHHLTHQHLRTYDDNFWIIVGYFFHDRGTTEQKSSESLLRHILHQILSYRKQLFILIQNHHERQSHFYDQPKSLHIEWPLSTLREALSTIARKSTISVNLCLFVDALDEHSGNHRDLIQILIDLSRITENPHFRVRLVLAGRPENVFKSAFKTCSGFSIHQYTTNDILQYAEGTIRAQAQNDSIANSDETLRRLTGSIVQKAEGVFLWVKLVVNEVVEGLCEGDTIEELQNFLSTLPTVLEDLYTRALRRPLRSSSQALTKQKYETYIMFQIESAALRPFPLPVFLAATQYLAAEGKPVPKLQALSRDQLERRLNSRSAGLLETSGGREQYVQFIHQTTKEFVTSGNGIKVIREGLNPDRFRTGFTMIFQFIIKLYECTIEDTLEPELQDFFFLNCAHYAHVLEQKEQVCFASFLPPAYFQLSESTKCEILDQMLPAPSCR